MTTTSRQMTKGPLSGSDKKLYGGSDLALGRFAADGKEKGLVCPHSTQGQKEGTVWSVITALRISCHHFLFCLPRRKEDKDSMVRGWNRERTEGLAQGIITYKTRVKPEVSSQHQHHGVWDPGEGRYREHRSVQRASLPIWRISRPAG